MASQKSIFDTHKGIVVGGYVRREFTKKYWVQEVINIIIQFYMNDGGSLYVIGNARCGRLGLQEYRCKSKGCCKELTLCPPFDQNNCLDIATFENHTIAVDNDGAVWAWGNGKYSKLGNGRAETVNIPTKIQMNCRAIAVSVGYRHSLVLLQNGQVYSFGSNEGGQCGQGKSHSVVTPKCIGALKQYKVTQISAGGYHSACITQNGDLFMFGFNDCGQVGVAKSNGRCITYPTLIELKDKAAFIDCGFQHSLLITSNKSIYSFGDGAQGKLGHGDDPVAYSYGYGRTCLAPNVSMCLFSACFIHYLNTKTYKYGQLRYRRDPSIILMNHKWRPTLIESLSQTKITKCAAGEQHSICIDDNGNVWSFGRNAEGQCGDLGTGNLNRPKMIDYNYFTVNNIKTRECSAGGCQSCIISDSGELYVFGSNKSWQLGYHDRKSKLAPTKLCLPKSMTGKKVSMGLSHTALIIEYL